MSVPKKKCKQCATPMAAPPALEGHPAPRGESRPGGEMQAARAAIANHNLVTGLPLNRRTGAFPSLRMILVSLAAHSGPSWCGIVVTPGGASPGMYQYRRYMSVSNVTIVWARMACPQ